ncbi:MAG: hypothetical protein AAGB22_13550, partial [Bacteroidota bacterium]
MLLLLAMYGCSDKLYFGHPTTQAEGGPQPEACRVNWAGQQLQTLPALPARGHLLYLNLSRNPDLDLEAAGAMLKGQPIN